MSDTAPTGITQEDIDREVAEGQAIYDQLVAEGKTPAEIRQWWLDTSGVEPADLPHGHDEVD